MNHLLPVAGFTFGVILIILGVAGLITWVLIGDVVSSCVLSVVFVFIGGWILIRSWHTLGRGLTTMGATAGPLILKRLAIADLALIGCSALLSFLGLIGHVTWLLDVAYTAMVAAFAAIPVILASFLVWKLAQLLKR